MDTEHLLFSLKQVAERDRLHPIFAHVIDRDQSWWSSRPIFLVKAFELHVTSRVTDQVVNIFSVLMLLKDVCKVIFTVNNLCYFFY